MALESIVLLLLERYFPPKKKVEVSDAAINQNVVLFQRWNKRQNIATMATMFVLPIIGYFLSPLIEPFWYLQKADALFTIDCGKGLLGGGVGFWLGFAYALPISMSVAKYSLGVNDDLTELYKVWYDRKNKYQIRILAKGLKYIFLPLAICWVFAARMECVAVTQTHLVRFDKFCLKEEWLPLSEISAIEKQIGKVAPNGNYLNEYRYLIQFKQDRPWKSNFVPNKDLFSTAYLPMLDFIVQQTGLTVQEIITPQE